MMNELNNCNPHARRHFTVAMRWMDYWWDEDSGLIYVKERGQYEIRSNAWYALGLLMRNSDGDADRACRAIRTALSYQWNDEDKVYHGTFARNPEEFVSYDEPVRWKDYDPNWREFIGTTLALIVEEYAELVPRGLVSDMMISLRLAAEGAFARAVSPAYSNIALMSAYLLGYAGAQHGVPEWRDHADRLARDIYDLFCKNNAFPEYNSPTYYGVDLFALAQWREYGPTEDMRNMGLAMEQGLWRDIGRFYHAGLRNMCGPWLRSYGRDMTCYCTLVACWMATFMEEDSVPLPDLSEPFLHCGDIACVPVMVLLGAEAPDDAKERLLTFGGERLLERTITDSPKKVATAWLGEDVMMGGLFSSGTCAAGKGSQCHPAMIHWKTPDGAIGWIRFVSPRAVDATASTGRLSITCGADEENCWPAEIVFEVCAPGIDSALIRRDSWSLPGLSLDVDIELESVVVCKGDGVTLIKYPFLDNKIPECLNIGIKIG